MSLKKIILGIGANIGDDKTKIKNIQTAINYISQKKKIFFLKKASIYLTDPVNMSTNNWFFNTIISVKSSLSPKDLLIFLQNIEKNMGRLEKFQKKNTDNSKKRRYDDRIIDIDIIDYKGQIINIDNFLNLPHPKLHERKFVLYPLAEIYPNWTHPVLNKTVIEILENLNDNYICEKLNINF